MKSKLIIIGLIFLLAMSVVSAYNTTRLEINEIEVMIDGKKTTVTSDGDTIGKEAKPGSTVEFDVELRNLYTDDEDIDIEDIEVTITIEEVDDGEDLEDSAEISKIRADRDKSVTLKFDIPYIVDEDTFNVEIHVEGDDESGTSPDPDFSWNIELQVEKEKHELMIYKTDLTPEIISSGEDTYLDLEVINIGSEDEEEVVITIQNSDLGLYKREEIELDSGTDEDARFSETYFIDVPHDLQAGTYPIEIKVYYNIDRLEDTEKVQLKIYECLTDSDCGIGGYIGDYYCVYNPYTSLDDVWVDYRHYICVNAGTVNAYCSYEDTANFIEECAEGTICENGKCISPIFNKLAVEKVKFTYNGKSKTERDGGSVRKIEPGMTLKAKIYVENLFTEEQDIEIEDIEITVTIENIDDGDDLEEESDDFDVKAGKTKSETLTFEIPIMVDEDTYDMTIEVEGDDENGTEHTAEAKIELEVEKERHELIIHKAFLSPETVSCGGDTHLDLDIINIGEEDEEEVVITLMNDELAFNKREELELDSGTDEDARFREAYFIDVPEDLATGTYPTEIKVYYNTDRLEDTEKVDLVVEKCEVVEEVEEEEEEEVIIPEEEEEEEIVPPPITKKTFWDKYGLGLIIVGYVLVIIVFVALIVHALRK